MKCRVCRKPIEGKRRKALYCSGKCRSTAYRRSHGVHGPPGRRPKDHREAPPEQEKPRGRQAAAKARSGRSVEQQDTAAPIPPPRIAFDRQLLPQAPLSAFGYRLAGQNEATSQWVVVPSEPTGWRLAPFQSPDDTRLIPGCRFRVFWVDENGQEIPPENTGTIPELYFFTGPADPTQADPAMESLIRTCIQLRAEVLRQKKELRALSEKLEDRNDDAELLEEEVEDLKEEVKTLEAENEKLSKKSLYTEVGEVVLPIALGLGARQLIGGIQNIAIAKAERDAAELGARHPPESLSAALDEGEQSALKDKPTSAT